MKLQVLTSLIFFFGLESVAFSEDRLLFDGKTLDNWTTLDGKPIRQGWEVVEGVIHLLPSKRRVGHIISKQEYGDFLLRFEWRIAVGGNSGLKYRVKQYGRNWRGCEYQIQDDARYHKAVLPRNGVGSLYDLFAPNGNIKVNPIGEFNLAEILVLNNRITHRLNGVEILSVTVGDQRWKQRVASSKFSELKKFGENQRGKIMLTDHGSEVWYRNIEFQLLEIESK